MAEEGGGGGEQEGALNVGKTLGAQKSQLYGNGQDRACESDGGLILFFFGALLRSIASPGKGGGLC